MNMCVHVFVWVSALNSLDCVTRTGIAYLFEEELPNYNKCVLSHILKQWSKTASLRKNNNRIQIKMSMYRNSTWKIRDLISDLSAVRYRDHKHVHINSYFQQNTVLLSSLCKSVVLKESSPTASVSPGSLLEMIMTKPYPELLNQKVCGCGPATCTLSSLWELLMNTNVWDPPLPSNSNLGI